MKARWWAGETIEVHAETTLEDENAEKTITTTDGSDIVVEARNEIIGTVTTGDMSLGDETGVAVPNVVVTRGAIEVTTGQEGMIVIAAVEVA